MHSAFRRFAVLVCAFAIAALAAPAIANATAYIYVTNRSSDTLSVISTATQSLVYTMSVGDDPFDIVISGTGAYIANQNTDNVSFVDLSRHRIIATIAVGDAPQRIVLSGTGVFVSNTNDDTVSVIDTTTNTVDRTISVGDAPMGIAVSGTGVFVANQNAATVSMIDTTTLTAERTISVQTNPRAIAVSGTGVYVANYASNTVSVIDSTNLIVERHISVGTQPEFAAASGTGIFISNVISANVSVIDVTSQSVDRTISVTSPRAIAISGTGVYIPNASADTVTVIDKTNLVVERTIDVGDNPRGVAVGTLADIDAPTVSAFTPADGATDISTTANLVIEFSRNIGDTGEGTVRIYKASDDSLVESIDVQSSQVTGSGTDTMTINPTVTLANGTDYYVQIDSDAFPNIADIFFTGISDETTWNFTTVAAPASSSSSSEASQPQQHAGGVRDATLKVRMDGVKDRFSGKPTVAPPSTIAPASTFTVRTCDRVMRRFGTDAKMLTRINERLQKRFGFVCGI